MNAPHQDDNRLSRFFAAEIRAEMARQQVTNRELARRISAVGEARSEPTISRLLRGTQRLNLDDVAVITEALGLDVIHVISQAAARRDAEVGRPDVEPFRPLEG